MRKLILVTLRSQRGKSLLHQHNRPFLSLIRTGPQTRWFSEASHLASCDAQSQGPYSGIRNGMLPYRILASNGLDTASRPSLGHQLSSPEALAINSLPCSR